MFNPVTLTEFHKSAKNCIFPLQLQGSVILILGSAGSVPPSCRFVPPSCRFCSSAVPCRSTDMPFQSNVPVPLFNPQALSKNRLEKA